METFFFQIKLVSLKVKILSEGTFSHVVAQILKKKRKKADQPTHQVKPFVGNAKQTFFLSLALSIQGTYCLHMLIVIMILQKQGRCPETAIGAAL